MSKNIPFKHGRKLCIFCGSPADSGEHVWPKWAHSLLPNFSSHEQITLEGPVRTNILSRSRQHKRQGSSAKAAIKRVCSKCNSGWMGAYEERLKNTLTFMIKGNPLALGLETQNLLREYFTYKLMVLDWSNSDPAFSDYERKEFFLKKEIPKGLKVIFSYCKDKNMHSYYRSHFMGMANTKTIDDNIRERNVKTFALGFGSIFLFALYVRDINLAIDLQPRPFWFQIIPKSLPLFYWPPLRSIGREEAETVAAALGNIKTHHNVRILDETQDLSSEI